MRTPDPWRDDPWIEIEVTCQWFELVAAWRRDSGICGICGKPVDLRISAGRLQPTIDHIVPFALGGADARTNIQIAHRGCNSWKGKRDLACGGTNGSVGIRLRVELKTAGGAG